MCKKYFILLASLIGIMNPALAAPANPLPTAEACSKADPSLCAWIEFTHDPSVQLDNPFTLNLEGLAPDFRDLRVDIWMEMGSHGHGSAPVEMKQLSNNRFQVSNVYFVMQGPWQVRLYFQSNGKLQQIVIPVQVQH